MKISIIIILLIFSIFVIGCTKEFTTEPEQPVTEPIEPDTQLPTCAEKGGECMDRCTGIHFESDYEVSDCPGKCCACCKQIIPECVPEQCCHPTSCVLVQWAPDCSGVACTEECREDTMDCGKGYCELDRERVRCNVVWTNKYDTDECKTDEDCLRLFNPPVECVQGFCVVV